MYYLRDKDLIKESERSKARLLLTLTSAFPSIQLDNLRIVADELDARLVKFLEEELRTYSELLFSLKLSGDRLHFLDRRDELYQVLVAYDVRRSDQLVVYLNPIGDTDERRREYFVSVDGYGRYAEIVLAYPPRLAFNINYALVHLWCKAIFETGYFWFFEAVGRITNRTLVSLADSLYGYARMYLSDDELRQHLWFSVIADGYGFRLLNREVMTAAFKSIRKNIRVAGYSTNRHMAELLCTYLPERIMLMRQAIDGGTCIDVDLRDAQYRRDGSIYALTMGALYGCESFTVYPLYKSERLGVGAVFDTSYRPVIEPVLDAHKPVLADMCARGTNGVGRRRLTLSGRLWEALELKPEILGFGIDLKKLFGKRNEPE